mmetsp:Transcript_17925/g.42653  ORF Transcript_17925/g.42653 Transcript_17925/m.42653 type:complete len:579 (+) Transcript_17925:56-1792(+)
MLLLLGSFPSFLTSGGRTTVAPSRAPSRARRAVQPRLAESSSPSSSPLSEDAIKSKLASIKRTRKRPSGLGSAPAPTPPPAAPPPEAVAPAAAEPAREAEAVDDGPPPMERLQAVVAGRTGFSAPLDAPTAAAIATFLNEELGDAMLGWVLAHTELGKQAGGKNLWSRGAWVPQTARLESLDGSVLRFSVGVQERGKQGLTTLQAELPLPLPRAAATADELRHALLSLLGEEGALPASAGAVLLRLPGSTDDWSLPDELWLNTTPYPRSVRNMFYEDVLQAMQAAVADPSCPRAMKVTVTPPELNMEMDSYRVGSLLELVRECALGFAETGLKTRVCVQGPMGGGVPRVLSGVNKLLTLMDWDAGAGEAHAGMLGDVQLPKPEDGSAQREGLVCFGAVGEDQVGPRDDVVIVLAPQSMVGSSIYELLRPMVERCEAQGTAVILINPELDDVLSSSGVMGVRGRSERIAFAAAFEEVYHFRNVYSGTTFMFPILGSVRMTRRGGAKRVLYRRREVGSTSSVTNREGGGSERYEPVGCWVGREPTPREITELVPKQVSGPVGNVVVKPAAAPTEERMPWD